MNNSASKGRYNDTYWEKNNEYTDRRAEGMDLDSRNIPDNNTGQRVVVNGSKIPHNNIITLKRHRGD
jgi:hypothetical protein